MEWSVLPPESGGGARWDLLGSGLESTWPLRAARAPPPPPRRGPQTFKLFTWQLVAARVSVPGSIWGWTVLCPSLGSRVASLPLPTHQRVQV